MKKLIIFIIFLLAAICAIIYFTYGGKFLTLLDEKKVYSLENIQTTKIDALEGLEFFNNGIITYNNQKIIFLDYSNNVLWKNEDTEFSKQVFAADNYIFRDMENTVQVLDKNGQEFIIAEIKGDIVNVSRENDKTYMIVKNGGRQNSLYIMNENNEMIVDNKVFEDNITGVSVSDKSEGYSLITLRFENGTTLNTVYFNLLDDIELWNMPIEDEILIKAQIVNNNVIVIGTKNVYYFDTNGKLMWKNGIYNKILDYKISKENKKIYILYEKEESTEIISYDFEGKIKEVIEGPKEAKKLRVYGDKIFVYNESGIYLVNGPKTDKIYEDTENSISDFTSEGSYIRILSKDKLVSGQIK